MAAEVSSVLRIMNESSVSSSSSSANNKSTGLITRDLLGGCRSLDSKELDLDLQVPCGWEKRLDLKSGKVYLQRCSNSSSTTLEQHKYHHHQSLGDLNFPPASSSSSSLKQFDEPNLDLKLLPSSSPPSTSSPSSRSYQSVCTLEKVKSALERAEKETTTGRKRSMSSSQTSNSSSSEMDQDNNLSPSLAAGCPTCLLYVLISKNHPKCPRCHTIVPLPLTMKKPRIDLNISI